MFSSISENNCPCGREHKFTSTVLAEKGAVKKLPEILKSLNAKKVFLVADQNTYKAAGETVVELLNDSKIEYKSYIFNKEILEPDESNVGLAVMHFDPSCDVLIGVGSGVINDICKIVANLSNKTYIIVATAPSMDGYASTTSSMIIDGHKLSIASKCAEYILGDIDILKNAPIKMMLSGLGDMVAKYIATCDWRISNLVTCEYYCESVAELVRGSIRKCVSNAEGLLKRDEEAVKAVFEGMVVSGVAMNFAGLSRPASGVEHSLSHIWDMRGVEFGTPMDFHGIQCAVGTHIAVGLYERIKKMTPDREKALEFARNFDYGEWSKELKRFVGKSADGMIALEQKEQKYALEGHEKRISRIVDNWDEILKIIDEEVPSLDEINRLFNTVGLPKTPDEIGIDGKLLPMTFKSANDIRDKYIMSRLCWDLGIIDELF